MTQTAGGLVVLFNGPIDSNTPVLYTTPGQTTYGPPNVTLGGCNTFGNVRGSLVIDLTNPNEATFEQTSGLLAADTYTLNVSTAVQAVGGYTLSGSYSTTVTVAATTTPVVSAPNFARGPGQSVSLANSGALPINITNATNVTSRQLHVDL